MDYLKVQRRAQRAMNDRILERYPMSNSDLFSREDDEVSDLIYRSIRFKAPNEPPEFQVDSFVDGVPVLCCLSGTRPQSISACAKCNRIQTNPRFRPFSFHSYGKLQNEQKLCESSDNSSEIEDKMSKRKSFSNKRRRSRLKHKRR